MKVNLKELVKTLEVMNVVCERRKTMPILAGTSFEEKKGLLMLGSTDLEISAIGRLKVIDFHDRPKKFVVNTESLLKLLKTFSGDTVDIKENEEGRVVFEAGRCKLKPLTFSLDEFPMLPCAEIKEALYGTINYFKVWDNVITKLLPFISKEESRVNLNGMLSQDGTLVATDGHRLGMMHNIKIGTGEGGTVLPGNGLLKLQKIIKKLKVDVSSGLCNAFHGFHYFRADIANVTVYMRVIDAVFPNWQQVLPVGNDKCLVVKHKDLQVAMTRAIAAVTEKYKSCKFEFDGNGTLGITTTNAVSGEMSQSIPCAGGNAGKVHVGLNSVYVLDYLKVVDSDDIFISIKDEKSQISLKCDDNLEAAIMPMKL